MNSSLYRCSVMHHRLEPKRHRFMYDIFMFYLDLDEIDLLANRLWFLSRNRFNLFNFRDRDHLQRTGSSVKENILDYLTANGVNLKGGRIMLLTNLATMGYTFNPVSFYFCFDERNVPICAVAEVGNTFGELKPYFLGNNKLQKDTFVDKTVKYFYVSPFVDMDTQFDFRLGIPNDQLNIRIDDFQNDKKFFVSALTGKKEDLTNSALAWFFLRFPFITLQIITLIHWQALKLYLKQLPYHKKNEQMDLQREVYYGRNA